MTIKSRMMEKGGCVCILTNKYHTVLYVGASSDLINWVRKHRLKLFPESFTAKYNCDKLVYYKGFHCIEEALAEELRIKVGSRAKKIELVNSMNETRIDFWDEIKHW